MNKSRHISPGKPTDTIADSADRKRKPQVQEIAVCNRGYCDRMKLNKPTQKLYRWFEKEFLLSGSILAYIGGNHHKNFLVANQRNGLTIRVLTSEHATFRINDESRARVNYRT